MTSLLIIYLYLTSTALAEECNVCIQSYCSIECSNTGTNCGSCIQKWCSYEC